MYLVDCGAGERSRELRPDPDIEKVGNTLATCRPRFDASSWVGDQCSIALSSVHGLLRLLLL